MSSDKFLFFPFLLEIKSSGGLDLRSCDNFQVSFWKLWYDLWYDGITARLYATWLASDISKLKFFFFL